MYHVSCLNIQDGFLFCEDGDDGVAGLLGEGVSLLVEDAPLIKEFMLDMLKAEIVLVFDLGLGFNKASHLPI